MKRPHLQSVRMGDVARQANVSPMTVSRALNNPEMVSEDTRARIFAAIEETGYVPNRLAGNLASNRSNTVGLIVPSIKDSIFADTIHAAANTLSAEGYLLLIADSGHSLEEEEKLVAGFLGQRVSGIILHNTIHSKRTRTLIENAGIPVVETGDLLTHPIDISVGYSNFEAAKAMTLHLAERGYKRIGFVSLMRERNDRARMRLEGYLAALKELGFDSDPDIMTEVRAGLEHGKQALSKLLEARVKPDAIFFAGDIMIVGAALECQRRNIQVPGEIALAGFDDLDILQHIMPSITSLRLPRAQTGDEAARAILQRIENLKANDGDQEVIVKDLGFEIAQRQST